MVPPLEVFQVLFFVPTPFELMSGVSVALWVINMLLVSSFDLVQLTPISSPESIHYVCCLIFSRGFGNDVK